MGGEFPPPPWIHQSSSLPCLGRREWCETLSSASSRTVLLPAAPSSCIFPSVVPIAVEIVDDMEGCLNWGICPTHLNSALSSSRYSAGFLSFVIASCFGLLSRLQTILPCRRILYDLTPCVHPTLADPLELLKDGVLPVCL